MVGFRVTEMIHAALSDGPRGGLSCKY